MARNPYVNLLQTAWKYARDEKRKYLLIYSCFTATNLINAARPVLYGWFINSIQKEGWKVLEHAWIYAGIYLGLNVLEWAIHGPARVMERSLAFNLGRNFLQETYHRTLMLPAKWHQDHHSGSTINRIRKSHEALRDFFQNGFMYFHAFIKFLISFVAMLYFSPLAGGVGIILGIFTIYLIFKFDKPFIKAVHETNEKEHTVSATLFDSLSNIITVITLRLEKRMESSLGEKIKAVFKPFMRNVVINEWKWFVADTLVALIYVVVAVGFVMQHHEPGKVFYVGALVTLLGYVNQFTSVFHDVAWQYTQIVQYNTDVMAVDNINQSFETQHRPENTGSLPADWQSIQINQLNYSHSEQNTETDKVHDLKNINLQIRRGKRVAIIGESGSGKSTLLALLRGLYQPREGLTIAVDGKPQPGLGLISETVTLFPQEPEIFENTIHYNITLGLDFSKEEVDRVSTIAAFKEVVNSLPNGYDSHIQEKGVNLSGGQKQRLALARGVLAAQSSEIVLLDEPTSSVDPKTELQIYRGLFEAFQQKAMISSLHRLHLLTHFDYIYVMKDGRIVEEGSLSDLRKSGAVFNELWKHQEREKDNGYDSNPIA